MTLPQTLASPTVHKAWHYALLLGHISLLQWFFLKGHQQEPLISFATKDFYGLFSLFSRLLALQNLSVLREVPIPPYSQDTREGGSLWHVLSPGVP